MAASVVERWNKIKQTIAQICAAASRDSQSVTLLAVSKFQPLEAVRDVYHAGQRQFGENYAQELFAKAAALADLSEVEWHFIGTLQSNKIKKLVAVAHCIQSVTTEKHVQMIAKAAVEIGRTPYPIFIEVNLGDEASKSGLTMTDALVLGQLVQENYPQIELRGLMAIPPQDLAHGPDRVPSLYRELAAAAKKIGKGALSLGMSDDLEPAIRSGSTMVRVGTAIFGERPPSK